jgi:hypothetical protein
MNSNKRAKALNRKGREGIRKVRKDNLAFLCVLRESFVIFAVKSSSLRRQRIHPVENARSL